MTAVCWRRTESEPVRFLLSNAEFGLLEAAAGGTLHRDVLQPRRWVNHDGICYPHTMVESLHSRGLLVKNATAASADLLAFMVLTPAGHRALASFRDRTRGRGRSSDTGIQVGGDPMEIRP